VKHAGTATLDSLEPLLERLRATGLFKEKSRGAFYRKSRAFLHFHEDPAGVFADLRGPDGKDFERMLLSDGAAWDALVDKAVARAI
jgi:hypothetical protein